MSAQKTNPLVNRMSYVVNPGMVIVLKLAGGPGVLNQSSLLDAGSS